jgi:hypothetical protein
MAACCVRCGWPWGRRDVPAQGYASGLGLPLALLVRWPRWLGCPCGRASGPVTYESWLCVVGGETHQLVWYCASSGAAVGNASVQQAAVPVQV